MTPQEHLVANAIDACIGLGTGQRSIIAKAVVEALAPYLIPQVPEGWVLQNVTPFHDVARFGTDEVHGYAADLMEVDPKSNGWSTGYDLDPWVAIRKAIEQVTP